MLDLSYSNSIGTVIEVADIQIATFAAKNPSTQSVDKADTMAKKQKIIVTAMTVFIFSVDKKNLVVKN